MKSIVLKKYKGGSAGMFGTYYKISKKKGVKILKGRFNSLKELKKSKRFKEASEELELLKKASARSHLVPKGYSLTIVKTNLKKYRIGIILAHIDGYHPYRSWPREARAALKRKLKAKGIIHTDLHYNNVLIKGKTAYAIDFSPGYATIKE